MKNLLYLLLLLTCLSAFGCNKSGSPSDANIAAVDSSDIAKIDGLSFVSPPSEFPAELMADIPKIGAGWIALSPFAFSRNNQDPEVRRSGGQWWGERPEGIRKIIDYARQQNIKVMLKPQVWIPGGWVGEYDPVTEENWLQWEKDYRSFVMEFVQIAVDYQVDIFCIGTEYKVATRVREAFWRGLIKDIRAVYSGKLTYASNWDNYENIPFWEELDFAGLDAYFPLIEDKTPAIDALLVAWQPTLKRIEDFQKKINKPILFTEYGYLCVDGAAGKLWEIEKKVSQLAKNDAAQSHAFEALFQTFWDKEWFAGGFIWKWYIDDTYADLPYEKGYDPKGKDCYETIKKCYDRQ